LGHNRSSIENNRQTRFTTRSQTDVGPRHTWSHGGIPRAGPNQPAAADDSTDGNPTGGGAVGPDDGFFTRIKILGSTTGQMQKDNATLSAGSG
jgi:hypothetical protein